MYQAAGTRKLQWLWWSRAYSDACLPASHSVKISVFNSVALKPSSERFWVLGQKTHVIFDTRPSAFPQPRIAAPCTLFFSHVLSALPDLEISLGTIFPKQHYCNLLKEPVYHLLSLLEEAVNKFWISESLRKSSVLAFKAKLQFLLTAGWHQNYNAMWGSKWKVYIMLIVSKCTITHYTPFKIQMDMEKYFCY